MIKLSQGNSEDGAKETEAKIMRERVLRVLLSPEARQRLTNVKMVKPDLAKAVEDYIISMGSQGKLNKALTDDDLKQILSSIQQPKRDFKINYK
ncbi:MAG TPA: DNA-binding protein [Nitrososphaerales archaeon]|nr:DNA-binding protein [Nitrososphaerales archaeon]